MQAPPPPFASAARQCADHINRGTPDLPPPTGICRDKGTKQSNAAPPTVAEEGMAASGGCQGHPCVTVELPLGTGMCAALWGQGRAHAAPSGQPRDASEGKGPLRRPHRR